MAMKRAWMGSLLVAMLPTFVSAAAVELAAYSDKPLCEKVAKLFGEGLNAGPDLSKTVESLGMKSRKGAKDQALFQSRQDEHGSEQRWAR